LLGAVAEFCAMAELIMPAVTTTARAMVERRDTERISLLANGHDLETPDHGRHREEVVTQLRAVHAVLEISSARVRCAHASASLASPHIDHAGETEATNPYVQGARRLHIPATLWSSMSCPV
jgi:hypothetical protein